jgi:hypothetical protein
VGVAVGLVAGTVGVGVSPVVGVGVTPVSVVGFTVGLVAGVVGVADAPTVGVAPVVVVGVSVAPLLPVLLVAPLPKAALIATPLPSVVTVIGSGVFNKPTQFSPLAPKLATKRCARKVKSELAAAGSGEGCPCVSCISSCMRAGPIARRCWQ